MFRNTSSNVIDILKTKNVTGNYHQYCVTTKVNYIYQIVF